MKYLTVTIVIIGCIQATPLDIFANLVGGVLSTVACDTFKTALSAATTIVTNAGGSISGLTCTEGNGTSVCTTFDSTVSTAKAAATTAGATRSFLI